MLLDVRLAPALDAFDKDHPPARRKRHRLKRLRDRKRRARVTLEQLDVSRPAVLSLSERTQSGPAPGHSAVIVAVDQIDGLQLEHR
jgi:hypothetical protein